MRYQTVYTRVWASPGFRSWSEDGRHLALYLLTCPARATEGLFRLPMSYAAYDLQWPTGRLDTAIAELESARFARLDRRADLVWIVKALKWNPPKGDKQIKGALNALAELPDSPLRADYYYDSVVACPELAEGLADLGWDTPSEGYPIGYFGSDSEGGSGGETGGSVDNAVIVSNPADLEGNEGDGYPIEGVSKGYPPSISNSGSNSNSKTTRSVKTKGDGETSDSTNTGGSQSDDVWGRAMSALGYVNPKPPTSGQLATIAHALGRGHPPDNLVGLVDQAHDKPNPIAYIVGAWRKLGQSPPTATTEADRRPDIPEYQPEPAPIDLDDHRDGFAAARTALDK